MTTKIVKDQIGLEELKTLAKEFYGSMIKGVADIERGVVAFGGEYHMDANMALIEDGNFDMMIGDEKIRQKVKEIVNSKII